MTMPEITLESGRELAVLIGDSCVSELYVAARAGDKQALAKLQACQAILDNENLRVLRGLPGFEQTALAQYALKEPQDLLAIVHNLVHRTAKFGESLKRLSSLSGISNLGNSNPAPILSATLSKPFASLRAPTTASKELQTTATVPTINGRQSHASAPTPGITSAIEPATSRDVRSLSAIRLYGATAFCFSEAQTRDYGDGRPLEETIMVEAAPRNISPASRDPKSRYDWAKKISVQFSRPEVLQVLSVLRGYIARAEFLGHGQENEKAFLIERDIAGVHVMVRQKGKGVYRCQIRVEETIGLLSLILKQILKNEPHLNPETLFKTLETTYKPT